MQTPWLVQRLLKPFANAAKGVPTIDMVFGGARDLNQERHDVIADLFRLDSMGSAHFEFGAIPKALHRLATNKDLRPYQIELTVKPEKKGAIGHYKLNSKTLPVYVIAHPQRIDAVLDFIKSEAKGQNTNLKCPSDFSFAFFADEITQQVSYEVNKKGVCGWHDIENDFLYFLNRDMFDAIRETFEIQGEVTTLGKTPKPRTAKDVGPSIP